MSSPSNTAVQLIEEEQRASDAPPSDWRFLLTLALFFASGAAGLIDQLCFCKYLTYILGATAYAVSAVLSAFMAGLAIGAYFGGKLSLRVRRPLFAYGVLELVVAVAVALAPFAFKALTPLYAALARSMPSSIALLSVLRWLFAMSLVVIPTTAMGATLPLLSRLLPETRAGTARDAARAGRRLAALYAVNTLGGTIGALLSAYVVLPSLGIAKTVWLSASVSALVGVSAISASREAPAVPAVEESEALASPRSARVLEADGAERAVLYALAFASGWLVFACEVVFTHLLALIIGNSAYAFGLILAAFLCCLFIGASQAERAHRRFGRDALPLGLVATGAALALTLPLWDKLPFIFLGTGKVIVSFAGREAMRALVAGAILLVPAALMGLTFPLLLQRVAAFARPSQWIGRLTAVNTLGAVAGSLVTGYWVLPALGSERSLLAVALAFAAAALLMPRADGGVARRAVIVLSASTALFGIVLPSWDLARLTSGSNVYFDGDQAPATVLMVREDVHGGVTTVARREDVYTLYTNGKFQGNTGWEMRAQRLFAHYPCLFIDHFERALVIGLGTGTTLGTLTAYPWQKIDLVEISPSIAEAARAYFRVPNRGALDDPRVVFHHADGRNHLLVTDDHYDLISMELSSVWFAGASNLYSREYYELVRRHLGPNGVFQQWVQLHHIYRRDFATILHTLRQSFSHVALFVGGGQGILVASEQPLRASRARLAELEKRPSIRETVPDGRTLRSLFDDLLIEGRGLDLFLDESAAAVGEPVSALISTDDNLYLEYATPRGNILPWSDREVLIGQMARFRDPVAIAALAVP